MEICINAPSHNRPWPVPIWGSDESKHTEQMHFKYVRIRGSVEKSGLCFRVYSFYSFIFIMTGSSDEEKNQIKRINSRSKRETVLPAYRCFVLAFQPFARCFMFQWLCNMFVSFICYSFAYFISSVRRFFLSSFLLQEKMLSIRICFVDWREFDSTKENGRNRKSRLLLGLSKRVLICQYMLFNWEEY